MFSTTYCDVDDGHFVGGGGRVRQRGNRLGGSGREKGKGKEGMEEEVGQSKKFNLSAKIIISFMLI